MTIQKNNRNTTETKKEKNKMIDITIGLLVIAAVGFAGGMKTSDWLREREDEPRGFSLNQQLRDNEHFKQMWNDMNK